MQRLAESITNRLLSALVAVVARLPRRPAYWLGARLGDLAYLCLGQRRRVTLDNLEIAFGGEKSTAQRRAIARATFRNLGEHLIDFSRMRWLTPDTYPSVVTVEGLERVEHLLVRQAGLLMLSAHFGSWELGSAIALRLATRMHVIARPLDNPALHRLVDACRRYSGCSVIQKRQALSASLKALRHGEIVALLMDQSSLRREGIPVPFFGAEAYTSIGPALMALRSGCPVIGAFLVRQGLGKHRLVFSEEIPIQRSGDLRQDIADNTRRFNQLIESYVRAYPDHWFWLHRRWKKR
jgi:KDO2-lipid IV(A) lauroyltransferase